MWLVGFSETGAKKAQQLGIATDATKSLTGRSKQMADHEIDISDFHIGLAETCDENDIGLYWRQRDLHRSTYPDGLFALEYPDLPQGKNTRHFTFDRERHPFSEYEDGEPKIMRRIDQYIEYLNSNKPKAEYGHPIYGSIFLVTAEHTMYSILKKVADKYGSKAPDYLWFTTKDRFMTTTKDETRIHITYNLGGEIFLTPHDYLTKAYSLLSL